MGLCELQTSMNIIRPCDIFGWGGLEPNAQKVTWPHNEYLRASYRVKTALCFCRYWQACGHTLRQAFIHVTQTCY